MAAERFESYIKVNDLEQNNASNIDELLFNFEKDVASNMYDNVNDDEMTDDDDKIISDSSSNRELHSFYHTSNQTVFTSQNIDFDIQNASNATFSPNREKDLKFHILRDHTQLNTLHSNHNQVHTHKIPQLLDVTNIHIGSAFRSPTKDLDQCSDKSFSKHSKSYQLGSRQSQNCKELKSLHIKINSESAKTWSPPPLPKREFDRFGGTIIVKTPPKSRGIDCKISFRVDEKNDFNKTEFTNHQNIYDPKSDSLSKKSSQRKDSVHCQGPKPSNSSCEKSSHEQIQNTGVDPKLRLAFRALKNNSKETKNHRQLSNELSLLAKKQLTKKMMSSFATPSSSPCKKPNLSINCQTRPSKEFSIFQSGINVASNKSKSSTGNFNTWVATNGHLSSTTIHRAHYNTWSQQYNQESPTRPNIAFRKNGFNPSSIISNSSKPIGLLPMPISASKLPTFQSSDQISSQNSSLTSGTFSDQVSRRSTPTRGTRIYSNKKSPEIASLRRQGSSRRRNTVYENENSPVLNRPHLDLANMIFPVLAPPINKQLASKTSSTGRHTSSARNDEGFDSTSLRRSVTEPCAYYEPSLDAKRFSSTGLSEKPTKATILKHNEPIGAPISPYSPMRNSSVSENSGIQHCLKNGIENIKLQKVTQTICIQPVQFEGIKQNNETDTCKYLSPNDQDTCNVDKFISTNYLPNPVKQLDKNLSTCTYKNDQEKESKSQCFPKEETVTNYNTIRNEDFNNLVYDLDQSAINSTPNVRAFDTPTTCVDASNEQQVFETVQDERKINESPNSRKRGIEQVDSDADDHDETTVLDLGCDMERANSTGSSASSQSFSDDCKKLKLSHVSVPGNDKESLHSFAQVTAASRSPTKRIISEDFMDSYQLQIDRETLVNSFKDGLTSTNSFVSSYRLQPSLRSLSEGAIQDTRNFVEPIFLDNRAWFLKSKSKFLKTDTNAFKSLKSKEYPKGVHQQRSDNDFQLSLVLKTQSTVLDSAENEFREGLRSSALSGSPKATRDCEPVFNLAIQHSLSLAVNDTNELDNSTCSSVETLLQPKVESVNAATESSEMSLIDRDRGVLGQKNETENKSNSLSRNFYNKSFFQPFNTIPSKRKVLSQRGLYAFEETSYENHDSTEEEEDMDQDSDNETLSNEENEEPNEKSFLSIVGKYLPLRNAPNSQPINPDQLNRIKAMQQQHFKNRSNQLADKNGVKRNPVIRYGLSKSQKVESLHAYLKKKRD